MRNYLPQQTPRMLTLVVSLASLSACGGGSDMAPVQQAEPALLATAQSSPAAPAETVQAAPAPATAPTEVGTASGTQGALIGGFLLSPSGTTSTVGAVITDVKLESTSTSAQAAAPVTFGHVFAPGHVAATEGIVGKLADGTTVPLQFDVKAKHQDGSVRHAVVSAVVPSLAAGQTQTMTLHKTSSYAAGTPATPAGVLSSGFTAAANITLNGQQYTVSADALLKSGKYSTWLAGPIVNEWHVSAPLTTSAGSTHPHLTARFAIRTYTGTRKTRVDVTIENNWAYEAAPQNFTYDAQIVVGGQPVFAKAGLTHYHHARWRKMFWWGGEPMVHIKHNTAYLIGTKALPNYDKTVVVSETTLANMKKNWTGARTEPMGAGMANPYMPSTGGRPDIGLLPGWAATYLVSMDKRAKEVTLGMGDMGGSWSAHYRDQKTDRPVSIVDFPYMTISGNRGDTYNPVTKQMEAFPVCATTDGCKSVNVHDTAHQPGFAYLPYLVTGDYYYLEELQFWAMFNTFSSNPHYREYGKGLFKSDQVRGQGWSMRTAGEVAYITPDTDPLKKQFENVVNLNLDWYNANYTNSATANSLGVLINGYALGYNSGTGLAPWQDDFFSAAVGHVAELGFEKAKPLMIWKAKFPVDRMTAPGACWIDGAIYAMKVRDSSTSPLYSTMAQAYVASHTAEFNKLACASSEMATALKLKVGEMTGYSYADAGYPANMQPALAYSVDAGAKNAATAWSVFMGRSVKPNYGLSPQFAIVPR